MIFPPTVCLAVVCLGSHLDDVTHPRFSAAFRPHTTNTWPSLLFSASSRNTVSKVVTSSA